jgi:hypothetical protein
VGGAESVTANISVEIVKGSVIPIVSVGVKNSLTTVSVAMGVSITGITGAVGISVGISARVAVDSTGMGAGSVGVQSITGVSVAVTNSWANTILLMPKLQAINPSMMHGRSIFRTSEIPGPLNIFCKTIPAFFIKINTLSDN